MIFLRSHVLWKIKQLCGSAVETPPGVTGLLLQTKVLNIGRGLQTGCTCIKNKIIVTGSERGSFIK